MVLPGNVQQAPAAAVAAPATGSTPYRFIETARAIEKEVGNVIVGQPEVVRGVLTCLLAGGHALLEGIPGLGKTLLVRTIGEALDLSFSRVQFTPDLMPADITGTTILRDTPDGGRSFEFQLGPLFANLVLADEVNRATPKTQSALLEAMQERHVTAGRTTHNLPEPFFVLATQNPIEMEGTYPLPEAQLDRFLFKLTVPYPGEDDLLHIAELTTGAGMPHAGRVADGPTLLELMRFAREVPIAEPVTRYAVRIVRRTNPQTPEAPPEVRRFARYGSSPRGVQSLVLGAKVRALLEGRYNVAFEDIRAVAPPALRHRVILGFEADAEGISTEKLVHDVVSTTPEG
jgi:MoxR-like ATPase